MQRLALQSPSLEVDLPSLAKKCNYQGRLYLILGTSAGVEAPNAVNLDVMHGQRFALLPQVNYYYYKKAEHAVTYWLNEQKQFDAILLHGLFDAPAPLESQVTKAEAFSHDAPAVWPSVFAKLDITRVTQAEQQGEVVLVDQITVGAPLYICLSDSPLEENACFDFFPLRYAFINQANPSCNLIMLRDPARQWFLRGIAGLGESMQEMLPRLQELLHRIQASRVICIGNGMGAYAALILAAQLNAQQVIAFSPLSILDLSLAQAWHDERYLFALQKLQTLPIPAERDLFPLLTHYSGHIDIVCDSLGIGQGHDVASHDMVHAQRLRCLPCVQVHTFAVGKALLPWLQNNVIATGLLQKLLFSNTK
jgi:pimeloyl-ACP methyl ester carboxylesterase